MLAHLRSIRISAKKLNLIADLVRGKPVNESITLLKFIPKKGALIVRKGIISAAANAEHNFKQNRDDLFIETIDIGRGMFYKRYVPASRGRTWPLLCGTANMTIRIGVKDAPKPSKNKKIAEKDEAKPEVKTTEKKTESVAKKTTTKKQSPKKDS